MSSRLFFLCDYDGTLAPFVDPADRLQAKPYVGVKERLAQLICSARVQFAMVSGRPAGQVRDLLGLSPSPRIHGCYGLEFVEEHADVRLATLCSQTLAGLDLATVRLSVELQKHALPTDVLEQKHGCLAVHWRGRLDAVRRLLEIIAKDVFADISHRYPTTSLPFNGGIELRAAVAKKEKVIAQHTTGIQPDQTLMLYLGDDHGDEEAFKVINERGGMSILVGPQRPSNALFRLEREDQLRRFLDLLIKRYT